MTDQLEVLDEEYISALEKTIRDELWPLFEAESKRAKTIDVWLNGGPPVATRKASPEHKELAKIARTPWLLTVSTVSVQMLLMEDVFSARRTRESLNAFFKPWEDNSMESKQVPLYRSSVNYGVGYAKALPGDTVPVISTYSPKSMIAVYENPAEDLYPKYALEVRGVGKSGQYMTLTDNTHEHVWWRDSSGRLEYSHSLAHGANVCPVIRYLEDEDTEGVAPGEIERLIDIASRTNKTVYDRLLVQHYNSWKVRTATGLQEGMTAEETQEAKLKLANDDILTGTGEMQFGTLAETPIEPFQSAHDSNREDLAAVSQTPLPAVGKMINVGDDGVTAAWAGLHAKSNRRKRGFGQNNMDLLRLCAYLSGNQTDAQDYSIKSQWAKVETLNLSQAADAYGKLASQLGIPTELLIPELPDITSAKANEWVAYMQQNPSPAMIEAQAIAGRLQEAP